MTTQLSALAQPVRNLARTTRAYVDTHLFRLRGPEHGSIELVQRRVYILPTRYGLLFVVTLALMLTGSINYTLSLGFVLTFFLTALGVLSILHTFRNLARLRITAGRAEPVFAGGTAHFTFRIDNATGYDRYALGFSRGAAEPVWCDVQAHGSGTVRVSVPAAQRGRLQPGCITLFTRYPLGLCQAWAYVDLDAICIIYPLPEPPGGPAPPLLPVRGEGAAQGAGRDDFGGLRAYQPGDSLRHIAWKAAARDQGLQTKLFTGHAATELWLDWRQVPTSLGTEGRVSRLARWVLNAYEAGVAFGLRLPGVVFAPAAGPAQRERCLAALAVFDAPG